MPPCVLVATILGVCFYFDDEITTATLIASLLAFSVTFPGRPRLQEPAAQRGLYYAALVHYCLVNYFPRLRHSFIKPVP